MKKNLYFQLLLIIMFLFIGEKTFAQIECNPGQVYNINLSSNGTATFEAVTVFPDTYTNAVVSIDGGLTYSESITFDCSDIDDFFITARAMDGTNQVDCVVHVVVQDLIPPIPVVEADYTIYLVNGEAHLTAAELDEASFDNCGIASMEISQTTFTEVGTYSVVFTATDGSGNSTTAFVTVTVSDNNTGGGAFECTTGLNAYLGPNGITNIYASDMLVNSQTGTLSVSRDGINFTPFLSFNCDDIGDGEPIEVTVRLEENGETMECSSFVYINDILSPVAIVTSDLVLALDSEGEATLTPEMIDAGSYDNCGIASMNLSKTFFTTDDLGENIIALTVTDASWNTSYAWINVLVVNEGDCVFPEGIQWPEDLTINEDIPDPSILTPEYLHTNYGYPNALLYPTIPTECGDNIAYTFMDEVIFTGTPVSKILRTWTVINWDTNELATHIQIIEIQQENALTCYGTVVISTENGPVQLYAAELIEQWLPDYFGVYLLVITDADGNIVPNNLVTSDYSGQVLSYTVSDAPMDNSCSGSILVDSPGQGCPIDPEEDIHWPLAEINIYDTGATAADLTPENLVADYGFEEADVNVVVTNDCAAVGLNYADEVFESPDGHTRIFRTFTVVDWYYDGDPNSTGVWQFSQIINIEDDLPLLICDVLPHTAPVGDCESGHTLDDDVEWPADIAIADHRITPNELMTYSDIDEADAAPVFYDNNDLYTTTYTDLLAGISTTEILVDRVWVVKYEGYDQVWEYTQRITIDITGFVNLVTVNTTNDRAMPYVRINQNIFTDEDGKAYVGDAEITSVILNDDLPNNGVDILDLVLANHHRIGLHYILSPDRFLADIDEDGEISATDEMSIQQIIFSEVESPWQFMDKTEELNMNPGPKAHFVGYKLGDINDSALLPTGQDVQLDESFAFSFDDLLLNQGEAYEVPVYLNRTVTAFGVEYRMIVNMDIVTITDVTSNYFSGNIRWHIDDNGNLVALINNDDMSATIGGDDSDPVLILHLVAQSNSILHLAIDMGKRHQTIATTDYNAVVFDGAITNTIQTGTEDVYLSGLKIYPNPTARFIHVDTKDLAIVGEFQFSLYTISGREVLNTVDQYDIDISNLPEGMYYYRVVTGEHQLDGKIGIIK